MEPSSRSLDAGIVHKLATLLIVKGCDQTWLQRFWPETKHIITIRDVVIKVRPLAHLGEAQTMRYLAQHTSIPVPKVLWAFIHDDQTYTVMSKVEGEMLCETWVSLAPQAKEKIFAQLRVIVADLRAIRRLPPDVGIASITGGPIADGRLPGPSIKGPFATVDDFHKALVNDFDFRGEWTLSERYPALNELYNFYRQARYDTVLTHGDLSSLNIMVSGDRITGIIDWQTAGWYPAYWEYTTAKAVNNYNTFWEAEVDKFITPFPVELAMDRIRLHFFNWYGMDEDV